MKISAWKPACSKAKIDDAPQGLQSQGYRYVLTDSDGRKIYFKLKSGSTTDYEDDSDSGLTLFQSSQYMVVKDSSGYQWVYVTPSSGGHLYSEKDANGNTTTYSTTTYTPTGQTVLNNIKDASGATVASFTYGTYGNKARVTKITDFDGREYTFTYGSSYSQLGDNCLTSIKYPDNRTTSFTYIASGNYAGRMEDVYTGNWEYCVSYTYDTRGRVTRAVESDADLDDGNYLNIAYSEDNTTTFTDRYGRTEKYQFDNKGNTVAVISDDGSIGTSQAGGYIAGYSVSEKYVKNYLISTNAEVLTSYTNKTFEGSAGTVSIDQSTALVDGEKAQYLGTGAIKLIQSSASQYNTLYQSRPVAAIAGDGKKATFSAYVKTSGISAASGTAGAVLRVIVKNSSGTVLSDTAGGYIKGTNKYSRLSHTFDVPTGAATAECYFGIKNSAGTSWFDCLQLEEGETVNSYNALENSDFSLGTAWNGPSTVTGSPASARELTNTIVINKANVNFNVYGTAQATSVPVRDNRTFGIRLTITYDDNTTETHIVPFNADTESLQKTAGTVEPYKHGTVIKSVKYGYTYDYNSGTMTCGQAMVNVGTQIYEVEDPNAPAPAETTAEPTTVSNTDPVYGAESVTDAYGNETASLRGTMKTTNEDEVDTSKPYMRTETGYTSNGNYVASTKDERGKTTTYNINTVNGNVNSVTDPKGNVTSYTYNPDNYNLTGASGQMDASTTAQNTYGYNSKNQLSTITHNGFSYTFGYDSWGNVNSVKAGTQTLAANTYASYNGSLTKTEFGNGDAFNYEYDRYDRIVKVKDKNNSVIVSYVYNNKSQIAKIIDNNAGITIENIYDDAGTLIKKITSGAKTETVIYEHSEAGTKTTTVLPGGTWSEENLYDEPTDTDYAISGTIKNSSTTDSFGRTTQIKAEKSSIQTSAQYPYLRDYTYQSGGGANQTTSFVSSVSNKVNGTEKIKYSYTYDDNGNITSVSENSVLVETYTYDKLNQLKTISKGSTTITYSYNAGGNITSVSTQVGTGTPTVVNYTYGDTNWKDKLTAYNGQSITYDAIGNPLSYLGSTLTWKNGRQLATLQKSGTSVSYTYDANGMRTQKTVGSAATQYYYDENGVLKAQTKGTETLWFIYDEKGTPVGFNYNNTADNDTDTFYYITNLQGDVTGLTDRYGTYCVTYTYDAWGKLLSKSGTTSWARTVMDMNPLRYRGYVYDDESGFYYLQSRYYDPSVGRFINGDDPEMLGLAGYELIGTNLFAYCSNNPVMNVDPTGYLHLGKHWWNAVWFVSIAIDVLVCLIPALWAISGFFKAKSIAQAAAKTAATMSRAKLRQEFVKLSSKIAAKTGWSVIKGLGGAIVDILFTIAGSSLGSIVASLIDRLDGRKDGYLFA